MGLYGILHVNWMVGPVYIRVAFWCTAATTFHVFGVLFRFLQCILFIYAYARRGATEFSVLRVKANATGKPNFEHRQHTSEQHAMENSLWRAYTLLLRQLQMFDCSKLLACHSLVLLLVLPTLPHTPSGSPSPPPLMHSSSIRGRGFQCGTVLNNVQSLPLTADPPHTTCTQRMPGRWCCAH